MNFKTPIVYNSGTVYNNTAVSLSDNKFAITYDDGTATDVESVIGDASGSNLVFGTTATLDTTARNPLINIKHSATRFVTFWKNVIGIRGTVCDVSGTTITSGGGSDSGAIGNFDLFQGVALSETRGILYVRDSGSIQYDMYVYTISGTTITFGTQNRNFRKANQYSTANHSICKIDTDKVLLTYQDGDNSLYGTAIILTISGDVVTFNTPFVFDSFTNFGSSVTAIDTSRAVIAFNNVDNSRLLRSCVLNISGTTITKGSNYSIYTANTSLNRYDLIYLGSNRVIYAYDYRSAVAVYASGVSYYDISGSTLTSNSANNSIISNQIGNSVLVANGTSSFNYIYSDNNNLNYGTAIYGDISIVLALNFFTEYGYNIEESITSTLAFDYNLDYAYDIEETINNSYIIDYALDYDLVWGWTIEKVSADYIGKQLTGNKSTITTNLSNNSKITIEVDNLSSIL